MKEKHDSKVFMSDAVGLSAEELKRLEAQARAVIDLVEDRLTLPPNAVIDWTLFVERKGSEYQLLAYAEWYLAVRPRSDEGRRSGVAFGLKKGSGRVYEPVVSFVEPLCAFTALGVSVTLRKVGPDHLAGQIAKRLS